MLRSPILHDLKEHLRRGEPLRVLFDSNILLDVFLQRDYAVPATRVLTFAELNAVSGFVCASAFGMICHHGPTPGPGRAGWERMLAAFLVSTKARCRVGCKHACKHSAGLRGPFFVVRHTIASSAVFPVGMQPCRSETGSSIYSAALPAAPVNAIIDPLHVAERNAT